MRDKEGDDDLQFYCGRIKEGGVQSEGLEDGALAEALDLLLHPAGEHEAKHPEVADEGPERVPECGGGVALHEEVAVPGEGVADDGADQEQPAADERRAEQAEEGDEGAQEVQPPGRRLGVLTHVEGPEFIQAPEIHGGTRAMTPPEIRPRQSTDRPDQIPLPLPLSSSSF